MATGSSRLLVLAAAVLFSTGGAAIKGCGLTGWQVACFRSGVAAIALFLLVPESRRRLSPKLLLVGIAYAATMILFVLGNKLTTAANAIFLQSTAPLYILVLAPLLLREKLRKSDLVLMLAIAAGLALFFVKLETPSASAPNPLVGNLLGGIAGITWAGTLLGLRWLERDDAGGLAAVVVGNALACIVALPFALPVATAVPADWLLVGYLGIIQIGLAYVLLTRGFRHVAAFEASLIILFEPTLNPVWAWLFQNEVPSGWALAGGAIILAASTSKTWLDQRIEAR